MSSIRWGRYGALGSLRIPLIADQMGPYRAPSGPKTRWGRRLTDGRLRERSISRGLRKTDIDLEIGVIMVKRSYDRVTTKGKRSDAIPVAAELRPYLEHALRVSPSDLVFPREDGTMHAETTQLEMVLRRALRKAGLASGYRHKCRKPGSGYVEAAVDPGLRKCPRHKKNNQLWVTQVVRADPLLRPPPHDRQPAHDARREHPVRAADHAAQRPAHDRALYAPRPGLPARRDGRADALSAPHQSRHKPRNRRRWRPPPGRLPLAPHSASQRRLLPGCYPRPRRALRRRSTVSRLP